MASPTKPAPAQLSKKVKKPAETPKSSGSLFLWIIILSTFTVSTVYVLNTFCEGNGSYICKQFKYLSSLEVPKSLKKHYSATKPKEAATTDSGKLSESRWMIEPVQNAKLFTSEEIKFVEGGTYYLVIVGHVFDVTSGKGSYAPGSGYFGFIGQDGSRAFVTGEFNEKGLTDNLDGLSSSDYTGIAGWVKFYFEKYTFAGYHVGKFFDSSGQFTPYFKQFREWVKDAEDIDDKEKDVQKLFPPCNVAWSADKGSTVWCTNKSGGIQRDWKGYPRKFFEKNKQPRCACVHPNMLSDPRLRVYEGCDPQSDKCAPRD